MNEVDTASVGSFNFPNFLNMMLRKVDEINAEDEIRQELGYVMDNLGEKMEKEEIESLINEIDIDGD